MFSYGLKSSASPMDSSSHYSETAWGGRYDGDEDGRLDCGQLQGLLEEALARHHISARRRAWIWSGAHARGLLAAGGGLGSCAPECALPCTSVIEVHSCIQSK